MYCCTVFEKIIENPESVYARETTFRNDKGVWWTDFSDGEYGDIRLDYCPFCGEKLK
ncbi:hypothetical protein LCGC14_0677130 [marine sediment metagenome]|uniref:Uncharacterized protein n=1 Tax=marine sediment metagenome TaxID=412755 RepID=A0A0F9QUA2_9ZZZZ